MPRRVSFGDIDRRVNRGMATALCPAIQMAPDGFWSAVGSMVRATARGIGAWVALPRAGGWG